MTRIVEDMAEEIRKITSVRASYKGHCKRNEDAAADIMSSPDPNLEELQNILEAYTVRVEKICVLDEKMEGLVDVKDIDEEIKEALEFNDKCLSMKNKMTNFLRMKREISMGFGSPARALTFPDRPVSSHSHVKLPKMVIKDYSAGVDIILRKF